MKKQFDLVKVGGSAFEIGRQVGEILKDRIPRAIDQIFSYDLTTVKRFTKGIQLHDADLSNENLIAHTKRFIPLFKEYCPGVLEEIRGIAEATGLRYDEALLLQIRGEIVYALSGGCTSFAFSRTATKTKKVYTGQNWDNNVNLDLLVLLHVTPDDGPRYLTMTFAGLTSFLGMNAIGVSQFGNSLPWEWCEMGIPHYPIKWRIYREKNMAGLRDLLAHTTVIQPGNYMMSDGEGEIADAEVTPQGSTWLDNGEGFIVHTNHFLKEPFASRPDLPRITEDSVRRYERLRSLVKGKYGRIELSDIQGFLADHDNHPGSICRHPGSGPSFTAASMIAEPEKGILHVCAGNPCEGEYVAYTV